MGLSKKDIVYNISSETQLSLKTSSSILESFLILLKSNKTKTVKISSFGTFTPHETPKRIGRNPITMDEFEIKAHKKISFKASNKVKSIIN